VPLTDGLNSKARWKDSEV